MVRQFFNRITMPMRLAIRGAVQDGDMHAMRFILRSWSERTPDVQSTVRQVVVALNIPHLVRPVVEAAAKLASEKNTNPFHGNRHFLEVFLLTAALGQQAVKEGRLNPRQFGNLLTAALIHDYKHDGTNNKGIQFRLEELAFQSARPALNAAGAGKADLDLIHAFVLSTDISRDFSRKDSVSPADSLKNYLTTRDPGPIPAPMRVLVDRRMVDAALMLQDADVGTSLLAKDISVRRSRALASEMGTRYQPDMSRFFFEKICREQMFSISGFKLIQPYMNQTMRDMGLRGAITHFLPAQRPRH